MEREVRYFTEKRINLSILLTNTHDIHHNSTYTIDTNITYRTRL